MTEPDVVYRPLPRYSVPVIILLIVLAITQCACGVVADLPTVQPTEAVGHVTATVPVVSANLETVNKDNANVQFTTTAPLHIRACAGIDCAVLAYLAAGVSVDVTVTGISGPGCVGAEWYAVEAGGVAGYVCGIYLETK
jgi:hypothetical protein